MKNFHAVSFDTVSFLAKHKHTTTMHKILLITSLIASAFWSIAAAGEGSIRGLGEEDIQTITIIIELNPPDTATDEDVLFLLNGPVWDTLKDFSTLTGKDEDEIGELELKKFEKLGKLRRGRRRLGYKQTTGGCRNCKNKNKDRRALVKVEAEGYKGAVTSAIKQWCKDTDFTNPCCKGNIISGIRYVLTK
jgi:hypothetical protein